MALLGGLTVDLPDTTDGLIDAAWAQYQQGHYQEALAIYNALWKEGRLQDNLIRFRRTIGPMAAAQVNVGVPAGEILRLLDEKLKIAEKYNRTATPGSHSHGQAQLAAALCLFHRGDVYEEGHKLLEAVKAYEAAAAAMTLKPVAIAAAETDPDWNTWFQCRTVIYQRLAIANDSIWETSGDIRYLRAGLAAIQQEANEYEKLSAQNDEGKQRVWIDAARTALILAEADYDQVKTYCKEAEQWLSMVAAVPEKTALITAHALYLEAVSKSLLQEPAAALRIVQQSRALVSLDESTFLAMRLYYQVARYDDALLAWRQLKNHNPVAAGILGSVYRDLADRALAGNGGMLYASAYHTWENAYRAATPHERQYIQRNQPDFFFERVRVAIRTGRMDWALDAAQEALVENRGDAKAFAAYLFSQSHLPVDQLQAFQEAAAGSGRSGFSGLGKLLASGLPKRSIVEDAPPAAPVVAPEPPPAAPTLLELTAELGDHVTAMICRIPDLERAEDTTAGTPHAALGQLAEKSERLLEAIQKSAQVLAVSAHQTLDGLTEDAYKRFESTAASLLAELQVVEDRTALQDLVIRLNMLRSEQAHVAPRGSELIDALDFAVLEAEDRMDVREKQAHRLRLFADLEKLTARLLGYSEPDHRAGLQQDLTMLEGLKNEARTRRVLNDLDFTAADQAAAAAQNAIDASEEKALLLMALQDEVLKLESLDAVGFMKHFTGEPYNLSMTATGALLAARRPPGSLVFAVAVAHEFVKRRSQSVIQNPSAELQAIVDEMRPPAPKVPAPEDAPRRKKGNGGPVVSVVGERLREFLGLDPVGNVADLIAALLSTHQLPAPIPLSDYLHPRYTRLKPEVKEAIYKSFTRLAADPRVSAWGTKLTMDDFEVIPLRKDETIGAEMFWDGLLYRNPASGKWVLHPDFFQFLTEQSFLQQRLHPETFILNALDIWVHETAEANGKTHEEALQLAPRSEVLGRKLAEAHTGSLVRKAEQSLYDAVSPADPHEVLNLLETLGKTGRLTTAKLVQSTISTYYQAMELAGLPLAERLSRWNEVDKLLAALPSDKFGNKPFAFAQIANARAMDMMTMNGDFAAAVDICKEGQRQLSEYEKESGYPPKTIRIWFELAHWQAIALGFQFDVTGNREQFERVIAIRREAHVWAQKMKQAPDHYPQSRRLLALYFIMEAENLKIHGAAAEAQKWQADAEKLIDGVHASDSENLRIKAVLEMQQGRLDEAEKVWRAYEAASGWSRETAWGLARIALRRGDWAQARDIYSKNPQPDVFARFDYGLSFLSEAAASPGRRAELSEKALGAWQPLENGEVPVGTFRLMGEEELYQGYRFIALWGAGRKTDAMTAWAAILQNPRHPLTFLSDWAALATQPSEVAEVLGAIPSAAAPVGTRALNILEHAFLTTGRTEDLNLVRAARTELAKRQAAAKIQSDVDVTGFDQADWKMAEADARAALLGAALQKGSTEGPTAKSLLLEAIALLKQAVTVGKEMAYQNRLTGAGIEVLQEGVNAFARRANLPKSLSEPLERAVSGLTKYAAAHAAQQDAERELLRRAQAVQVMQAARPLTEKGFYTNLVDLEFGFNLRQVLYEAVAAMCNVGGIAEGFPAADRALAERISSLTAAVEEGLARKLVTQETGLNRLRQGVSRLAELSREIAAYKVQEGAARLFQLRQELAAAEAEFRQSHRAVTVFVQEVQGGRERAIQHAGRSRRAPVFQSRPLTAA